MHLTIVKICHLYIKNQSRICPRVPQASGAYVLGFRIDPQEKLREVHKELTALYNVYSQNPVFGVEFVLNDKARTLEDLLYGCILDVTTFGVSVLARFRYLFTHSPTSCRDHVNFGSFNRKMRNSSYLT